MNPNVASALIGEGGSLLGTALQYVTGSKAQKKQFEYNSRLMDKQNAMNIANWQMENEYNSPSNQIARLRSAGLNPDLFYGQTSAATLGASMTPVSGSSVSPQSPISTDFGQSTLAARSLDIQEKIADSVAAKNYADANQTNQLTPWVSKEIQSRLDLNESNSKVLNEQVEKVRNESELLRWQSQMAKYDSEILSAVKESKISTILAENKVSQKQAEVIEKNFADLYLAQIRLAVAQSYASYVQSDAARVSASASMYNAKTNRSALQLDSIIRHGELSVKRLSYQLDKSMTDAGINNMNLQNEWRTLLKDVPIFGEAIHGLLSIPGSWFSGVSGFKPR